MWRIPKIRDTFWGGPHTGGCQNYGPFLGTLNIRGRINGDPKRDHKFDNHPYIGVYIGITLFVGVVIHSQKARTAKP